MKSVEEIKHEINNGLLGDDAASIVLYDYYSPLLNRNVELVKCCKELLEAYKQTPKKYADYVFIDKIEKVLK